MKELKMLFENKEVEIISIDNIAHFELYSTGMALGYITIAKNKDYPHKSRIDKTAKNAEISTVVHGVQQYLSEQQLYDFMLEAHTSKCKEFRKWVTTHVLPIINQTGGYVETNRESEFINNYFPSFADDTKLGMVQDLLKSNAEFKQKIAEQEPIIQAYKDLMTAKGYLQFIDVAAMVEIGRSKLFQFLRSKSVLTKQSNYNVPFGRFTKNGMFKVITEETKNGHVSSVTMVSPKGLNYIYKLIKKNDMLDEFNTLPLLEVQANA